MNHNDFYPPVKQTLAHGMPVQRAAWFDWLTLGALCGTLVAIIAVVLH